MTGWNSNTPKAEALAAADALEAELEALPRGNYDTGDEWIAYRRRYHAALDQLAARLMARQTHRPTTMRRNFNGARFALLGFQASSSSGLHEAIRNWISQVRGKAGGA
jgi:hypothetical protein